MLIALNAGGGAQGSSSNAMSPSALAWPSIFNSLNLNKSRSIKCDGTTVDKAEKILSTRPGNFFSHSRIKPLICLRCKFSCEPHKSHGIIGKFFTAAYSRKRFLKYRRDDVPRRFWSRLIRLLRDTKSRAANASTRNTWFCLLRSRA